MFRLSIVFLVIALIAGLLGFGVIAESSWMAAKILCFVFLVLAAATFLSRTTSSSTA